MVKYAFALTLTLVGCQAESTSSTTQALTTLDPATGIGFVGKGDVQSAFKWNNAGLQANAAGLSFSFDADAVYEQSCLHTTGSEHKVVQKTFRKTFELSSDVAFAARKNPQDKVTGFNLLGITGGGITAPTDLCNPGQSEPDDVWVPDPAGAYPAVTLTSSSAAELYVSFGGERHLIWTAGETAETED